MTRPLFDPFKAAGPPPPSRSDAPLSVSAAAALIASALERSLPQRLAVVGEISGFNERTHWYFRLKDEGAILDCVMFTSALRRVGFKPADGAKVVLTGRVEFYAKQGRTQFYAESMESVGAGELEQRFRALCAELKSLGWFDQDRKRPLPTFARRIAIVTSKTGAALQDVIATTRKRCPAVDLAVVDVRVQGDAAAPAIASAIRWLSANHRSLGIDALLLTRGGGSIEDLWAFNERDVAHAVLECAVPVVAAIGHETDTTVAELVADVRAATPTQAAMLLTPDRAALAEELQQHARRLRSMIQWLAERRSEQLRTLGLHAMHSARSRCARAGVRLERAGARLERARPASVLATRQARTAELAARLRRALGLAVERRRARIEALERELIIAGPSSVFARGYSVTLDASGRAIRAASEAKPGAPVTTRVADGSFRSIVADFTASSPLPLAPLPSRRRPRGKSDPNQSELF